MHLGRADLKILACLQENSRLTNRELAERVSLSPSQCSRRQAHLEKAGYISGYRAVLNRARLGLTITAVVHVTLNHHDQASKQAFSRIIGQIEAVQEAFAVTGQMDYIVKLVARDLEQLAHLINDRILAHEAVAHVNTNIVLETLKETQQCALPA